MNAARAPKKVEILDHFPYSEVRDVQYDALAFYEQHGKALLEIPTGEGKTAIGMTILCAMSAEGRGPLFYITPNKTQVDQILAKFPDRTVKMLGRAEYPCLYYTAKGMEVTAQESPCYMLKCGHRVDQETGQTEEDGAEPCHYFQQKFVALRRSREGEVIVTTHAFFLMNRLMVPGWRDMDPAMTIVDEAHRLAEVARRIFEYTLTDYHLMRAARLVKPFDPAVTGKLVDFVRKFRRIARKRSSLTPSLLKDEEVQELMKLLEGFDADKLERDIRKAVRSGEIDPLAQQEELKLLENLTRTIPRLVRGLGYALEAEGQRPLNFVVAFYYKKEDPGFKDTQKKARYHLTIRSYFVAPIVKKALGKRYVAYSATIGDPKVFGYQTSLKPPFRSFPSSFNVKQTKIFLPSDNLNLSFEARWRGDLKKTLRRIAATAKKFSDAGHRSLVVVISEAERLQFLEVAKEAELETMSYGDGIRPRDAAQFFLHGKGRVLVGTAANYAEGVDLPKGAAPVIFFLRPGYAPKDDPEAQFEQRRFGSSVWALWNHRVMMQALQIRGRNIRNLDDVGVCFFMSSQFSRFLYGALPQWLRPAYDSKLKLEAAFGEAMEILQKK
ncbi:DEAD/DEAH box helicase family protein [Patescibacteria group bacterium]|nr:DEAD/DEAH box helicase family protein [Patescibacteria group bacterium]